jgi:hypothetical protein
MHSKGAGVAESREVGKGKEQNILIHEPSVNKQKEGRQWVGDRLLPEVGKERRQQTTGSSSWSPTVRWLCSIEEQ